MALDFLRRSEREQHGDRVPPNQRLTDGSTPRIDLKEWRFIVAGEVEEEGSFAWEEFNALPQVTLGSDVHCVTGWSKLDNEWRGVAFSELMQQIRPKPQARQVMVHCYGGYTSNVALADLMRQDVLFAPTHNRKPLAPEHGGPVRPV